MRSDSDITPFETLRVLWAETSIGMFPSDLALAISKDCTLLVTSTRSSPERNFLTDFASPITAVNDLWMRKGETLSKLPSFTLIMKNRA